MTLPPRARKADRALTLLELVVVLAIIGVLSGFVISRAGFVSYWDEESFLRKLRETITFLHAQAVADQAFYILEFDLQQNSYKAGIVRDEPALASNLADLAAGAGNISLELAAFLNPSLGREFMISESESMPSLSEVVKFPESIEIEDIRTMRGVHTRQLAKKAYITFSPRGFSEFSVLHLQLRGNSEVTILVNPFSGLTDLYRERKEFRWTYGRKEGMDR